MIAVWIIIGVVALLLIATIVSYNRFVRQRNLVQESWRQIDVELNRRHDLIPNLVETVRGYAAHERGVFEAVTQARAAAQQTMQSSTAGPDTLIRIRGPSPLASPSPSRPAGPRASTGPTPTGRRR